MVGLSGRLKTLFGCMLVVAVAFLLLLFCRVPAWADTGSLATGRIEFSGNSSNSPCSYNYEFDSENGCLTLTLDDTSIDSEKKKCIPVLSFESAKTTFQQCEDLKTNDDIANKVKKVVVRGEGVFQVNGRAFMGCLSLEKVELPDGTVLGAQCFDGLKKLTTVVTANDKGFGGVQKFAFQNCDLTKLSKIKVMGTALVDNMAFGPLNDASKYIEYVPPFAFKWGDRSATLDSDGVLTVSGSGSIGNSEALQSELRKKAPEFNLGSIKKIVFEEDLTEIPRLAFANMTGLEEFAIPESVTVIDYGAFQDCTSLKSVSLPKGVTSLEGRVFSGCTSLSEISLHEGIASIGSAAFAGCTSLKSIVVPASVKKIYDGAFARCTSMTSIAFAPGSQLSEIGNQAFVGTTSLKKVDLSDVPVTKLGSQLFSATNMPNGPQIPSGLETLILPKTLEELGQGVLANAPMTNLVLPEGLRVIGKGALQFCANLVNLTLPSTIEKIDPNVFNENAGGSTLVSRKIVVTMCGSSTAVAEGIVASLTDKDGNLMVASLDLEKHAMVVSDSDATDGSVDLVCENCKAAQKLQVSAFGPMDADSESFSAIADMWAGVAEVVGVFEMGAAVPVEGDATLTVNLAVGGGSANGDLLVIYRLNSMARTFAIEPCATGTVENGAVSLSVNEPGLYVAVKANVVSLTFETNGGSAVDPQVFNLLEAGKATPVKPADPTREGYVFKGWFADAECTQAFDFTSSLTGNAVAYAKWENAIAPVDPGASGGSGTGGSGTGGSSAGGNAPGQGSVVLAKTGDGMGFAFALLAFASLVSASVAGVAVRRKAKIEA